MKQSKMFEVEGKRVETVNPITGCLHECSYCYAKKLAKTRLKGKAGYLEGFKPCYYAHAMSKKIGKDKTVFVSSMGDMWGYWIPVSYILEILRWCCEQDKSNTFYFLTKNPARYVEMVQDYPMLMEKKNFVFGCTIEGDSMVAMMESEAVDAAVRQRAMAYLNVNYDKLRKFVSIEPVMCFNLSTMVEWMKEIKPEFVYIGFDNHRNNLKEPSEQEVKKLIVALKDVTEVRLKNVRGAMKG